jgi:single-strand DNA-binding protein
MTGINTIMLVGNLGKDPEVRYAQSGVAICKMRIAITERGKADADDCKDATREKQ